MKTDVALARKHAANRFRDNRLIVDKQYRHREFRQGAAESPAENLWAFPSNEITGYIDQSVENAVKAAETALPKVRIWLFQLANPAWSTIIDGIPTNPSAS